MEYYFKYTLSEDEHIDFTVYTNWLAPWQRKARLLFMLRFFLCSAIGIGILELTYSQKKFGDRFPVAEKLIFISFIIILFGAFLWVYIPNNMRSRTRKILRKDENQHFFDENELTLTEDGIQNIDKTTSTRYMWPSITRFAVNKEYFYLYINTIQALIIPKRLFKNQNEIFAFDQFVTQRVSLTASFRSM